jgi:hypothetical protein
MTQSDTEMTGVGGLYAISARLSVASATSDRGRHTGDPDKGS